MVFNNHCFQYNITARLFQHDEDYIIQPHKYNQLKEITLLTGRGISLPTPISQIDIFKDRNNASADVHALDDNNRGGKFIEKLFQKRDAPIFDC